MTGPTKDSDCLAITVTATDRRSMDLQIDEAVTTVVATAMRERRRGIIVTRHSYGSVTVALSDTVPFGLTREHHEW